MCIYSVFSHPLTYQLSAAPGVCRWLVYSSHESSFLFAGEATPLQGPSNGSVHRPRTLLALISDSQPLVDSTASHSDPTTENSHRRRDSSVELVNRPPIVSEPTGHSEVGPGRVAPRLLAASVTLLLQFCSCSPNHRGTIRSILHLLGLAGHPILGVKIVDEPLCIPLASHLSSKLCHWGKRMDILNLTKMTSKIPQPPGVPLLGNVFDVDPSNTWTSLNKLAAKWGPIFKISALGTQIVFVCNAALLEEICDESRFRKCVNGPIVEIRQAVHASLFTAYSSEMDSVWGPAHRIMSPWVTDKSNQITFVDQRDTISAIVPYWTSKPSQVVNVADGLKRLNLQVVVWSFFHQKGDWMSGPFPEFLTAIDQSTMEAVKRPTRPKLLNWLFHQRGYDKDIRTMRSFCADVIAKRKSEQQPREDMLNVMLNGKDPQTGESLSHEQVIDEIINIFIGSATSPCFVTFALYYLLKNPQYITQAREEIDSILGADGELTYEKLQDFQFNNAILREAMRLSAVAPGFNIEPRPDVNPGPYVSLAGGTYQVSHKQAIIAVLGAVNRDPAVFDDPDAFRPERMLGEAYDKLPSGVKKGFGNGKRSCFGTKFAWQWSWITLITILREVDLELADKNYKIDGDINGAFCVQPWHFMAKVSKRKDRP
ncbi:hypothetical protein UA08_03725 [Talaromyces atroroseus]|uniref:Cytochrome P450 n=1 Tax=Talaromyces atroroseus TaxID=1441469 RepID=A0A225B288_TALAT|nr:hypothetical protein UA08_03725 [Talaromyces atroroseus]OKL61356.1 hypothetical protein UA08_03725 [Talaromyces atroroseus]